MSWKNHVPKRDPDGIIEKNITTTYGDKIKKKVMVWIKEECRVEFQAMQSRKEGWDCIQVNNSIKHCFNFTHKEWENFMAETILLAEFNEG